MIKVSSGPLFHEFLIFQLLKKGKKSSSETLRSCDQEQPRKNNFCWEQTGYGSKSIRSPAESLGSPT